MNVLMGCPFCDQEAEMRGDEDQAVWVECPECGAMTRKMSGARKEEDAVKLWNTRAREETYRDALEELAQLCLSGITSGERYEAAVRDAWAVLSMQ